MKSLKVFGNNLLNKKNQELCFENTRFVYCAWYEPKCYVTPFHLRYDILIVCISHKNQEILKDFEKDSARIQYIFFLISKI